MKQYATLKISEGMYELFDDKHNVILSGDLPKINYTYQHSTVFNVLSSKGWDFEFVLKTTFTDVKWYMMSTVIL